MANWKKVVVSGSSPEFLNVTSSGDVSASGKLYGGLDQNSSQLNVVVYNEATGELEYKELNLINAKRSPELYLIDIISTEYSDESFSWNLSYDSGSPSLPTNTVAPHKVSASLDGGATYTIISENPHKDLNDTWAAGDIGNVEYFNPGVTNETASIAEGNANGPDDRRTGLLRHLNGDPYSDPIEDITITLQSTLNITNDTNTPSPSTGDYPKRSFDVPIPGDTGSIEIYVNNNQTPNAVISLTGSNGAITSTVGDITFDISPSGSNTDVTDDDPNKAHRSGSFTIDVNAQNDGYNYAYAFYTGSRGTTQIRALTNFVEWFYDKEGAQFDLSKTNGPNAGFYSGEELDSTATSSISGINYFTSDATSGARIQQRAHCDNQYRNVYPSGNPIEVSLNSTQDRVSHISITQSGANLTSELKTLGNAGSSLSSVPLQSLSDVDEAYLTRTEITASVVPTFLSTTNGFHQPTDFYLSTGGGSPVPYNEHANTNVHDVQVGIAFSHFNKDTLQTGYDHDTINDYLINTATSASDNITQIETFRGENYRIYSSSWSTGDVPTSEAWISSKSIADAGDDGFNNGLLQYASYLVYPNKAGLSASPGEFTTGLGPTQVNDYSTGVTGERHYYRYFQVPTAGAGNRSVSIEFKGGGKIVKSNNALGSDEFYVELQRLGKNGDTTLNNNIDSNSFFAGAFANVCDTGIRVGDSFTNDTHHVPLDNDLADIDYATTSVNGINVATSVATFSESALAPAFTEDEYVIVKIVVPLNWTGYIDAMAIVFAPITAGNTVQLASSLSNLDTNA